MAATSSPGGPWALLGLALVGLLAASPACKTAEDRFEKYASNGPGSPVESEPARLASCSHSPRPTAEVLSVPGAPLKVRLVRAYHLCLGEYVALLRIFGATREVVQVVLEYERYDVMGRHPPRRALLPIARVFTPQAVRYHRITWREGRSHPNERGLRVRLAAVDFAGGGRWTAPPWPPSPAARPPPMGAAGPLEPLDKLHRSLRGITQKVKDGAAKLGRGM